MVTETTLTDEDDRERPGTGDGFHMLVMSPEAFSSQGLPTSGMVVIGRSSRCAIQIEDPLVSREHARLHMNVVDGHPVLAFEDTGSVNGTRIRDALVSVGQPVPIAPGDAVILGSTVVMVLPGRASGGPTRLWSHAYFEERVEDECSRSALTGTPFALARIRFDGAAPWMKVMPVLARHLTSPHVFAVYGPKDYEILFVGCQNGEAEASVRRLIEDCRSAELDGNFGVAWYPRNGRTCDALLAAANNLLRTPKGRATDRSDSLTTEAPTMERVRNLAKRVASSTINVLILGECGVGKDVLAQLIHRLSPRGNKPFVAINCAALTESLMDTELFGHEKGAFTGATSAKNGLLESANGGTIFLDEIGDMSTSMQARLLRVLETREVRPVGGLRPRPLDVRIVSATNKDLEAGIAKSEFRRDLLDRLNTMTLVVPPLRDRGDEIPALASTFVATASREMGRDPPAIADGVMESLRGYRWPGNVRELKNVMERAVALCEGSEIIAEHLPMEKLGPSRDRYSTPDPFVTMKVAPGDPKQTLPLLSDPARAVERQRIVQALALCNGNQTRAARLLGMPRRTFVAKLDYYEIPRPQKGATAGAL